MDNFFCVKLGYLTSAYNIPQVRCAIPTSSQKVHLIGTEDRKGRRIFVVERSRQNPVDIPEPSGAIVRCSEKNAVVNWAEVHVLDQGIVADDGGEQRRALDVPDTNRVIDRSGSQEAIVRAEDAVHLLIVFIRTDVKLHNFPPLAWAIHRSASLVDCLGQIPRDPADEILARKASLH